MSEAVAAPRPRPLAVLEEWLSDIRAHVTRLPFAPLIPPVLIFLVTMGGYRIAQTDVTFYQHHVYLAEALLNGSLDVKAAGIPDWYQDVVSVDDSRGVLQWNETCVENDPSCKKYLPYGPAPAILLMPGVAIEGTSFSEIDFALFLGAVNVVLFWYLLGELKIGAFSRWLGVIFFAFGNVHFYSATEGTLWFYNHVSAVFFLQLAIITFLKRLPLPLSAFLLGMAWLSRAPTLVAMPFFLYGILARWDPEFSLTSLVDLEFYKRFIRSPALKNGVIYGLGLLPVVLFYFWYNQVRFDSLTDTGFQTVYESYTNGGSPGGLPYSFYRVDHPDAGHFPLFSLKNIPLHIYTFFFMPPDYHPDLSIVQPSKYGLSIFLTSPAFIYAFFVTRKTWLKPACWIAIALVTVPLFMHYSQGWVQYGYRFMLDYMPFLAILTVMGFDDHQSRKARAVQIALIAISIASGAWGRYWANEGGW